MWVQRVIIEFSGFNKCVSFSFILLFDLYSAKFIAKRGMLALRD